MLSLRDENFQLLISEAQERGITIQELIRAVIIPDWVKQTSIVKTAVSITRPGSSNGNGQDMIVPSVRIRKAGNGTYTQL